jgi:hypothetical protein
MLDAQQDYISLAVSENDQLDPNGHAFKQAATSKWARL